MNIPVKAIAFAMLLCPAAWAQPAADIGYESIQAAYTALRNDPQAKFSQRDGWLIVSVPSGVNEGAWSLTPQDHPAHPAAVRRTPRERNGQIYLEMRVLCGAEKASCDKLVEQFKVLNQQVAEDLKARR